MKFHRAVWAALLALCLVSIGHAAEKSYTLNAQTVTDTGVSITFVDNGTGGSGNQFVARWVFVKNDDTADELYCNLRRERSAATTDRMIAFGEGFSFTTSPQNDDGGYLGIGCITASGETVTSLRVFAGS